MSAQPTLGAGLRALGAAMLELAWTRAELIAVELQEEKERAAHKFVLVAVSALFLAMGLLLLAALVIIIFWDTHRLLAATGITLLYLGIGAVALVRLREFIRESPPPFEATRAEFANDMQALRSRHE